MSECLSTYLDLNGEIFDDPFTHLKLKFLPYILNKFIKTSL
jgi:hypothetical protein